MKIGGITPSIGGITPNDIFYPPGGLPPLVGYPLFCFNINTIRYHDNESYRQRQGTVQATSRHRPSNVEAVLRHPVLCLTNMF